MTSKTCLSISLSLAFFFVVLSYFVDKGALKTIDLATTTTLQKYIPRTLDAPFSLLSLFGSFEVTTVILLTSIWFIFKRNPTLNIWAILFYIFGNISEVFGKLFLLHPSPPSTYYRYVGIVFPSSYIHTDYSYPSGHMYRITFITIVLLISLRSKNRLLTLTAALTFVPLMIVSRIYLGEHWLSDVIGGSLLGTSLGLLTYLFTNKNTS